MRDPTARVLLRFLRPGRYDPYTGATWALDAWTSCPAGVVAYPAAFLPRWIAHELWAVELDGPVAGREFSVTAPRARLSERVEAWDRGAAAEFVRSLLTRHPSLGYVPSSEAWTPAWEAAYVAAHTAGMAAETAGRDYAAAEAAEWAAQADWLTERLAV